MKIAVGTESKLKLDAVSEAIKELHIIDEFELIGLTVQSKVPETPYNKQTKIGSINRAKNCLEEQPGLDLYIGIESGLEDRYGDLYEEVW
jgi:non-canonical (house-cleaning) NTP pyrophosphatase